MEYLKSETYGVTVPAEKQGPAYVVKHKDLESVIDKIGASYDYDVVNAYKEHTVVVCRMTKDGRTISKVGEAVPETMQTAAERKYPVTLAANRAFGRCAIRLLELAKDAPVFSSTECLKSAAKEKTAEETREEPKLAAPPVREDAAPEQFPAASAALKEYPSYMDRMVYDTDLQTEAEVMAVVAALNAAEAPAPAVPAPASIDAPETGYGATDAHIPEDLRNIPKGTGKEAEQINEDMVITFGAYRGQSIREAYGAHKEKFLKYGKWLRDNEVHFPDPEREAEVYAIRWITEELEERRGNVHVG